jgi:hypothetical protein
MTLQFVNDSFADKFAVKHYHGYEEPFTRQQSPHAKYKNGSYVMKVNSDRKDKHRNGSRGIVLGSIGTNAIKPPSVVYFVSFDRTPTHPVLLLDKKLSVWEEHSLV